MLDPQTWTVAKAPEPVFQSDAGRGVWGTGHGSFFKSPDGRQDWQVYHATDNPSFGCFSGFRTTRAQRFTWNRDGRPNFGRPVSLSTDLSAPSGDATLERQFEDARVLARAGARSSHLVDPNFVGEAGTTVAATRASGSVTYSVEVPKAGRYRILVRLGTGPDHHLITLVLATTRRRWRLRTTDTHRAAPGVQQTDFGTLTLPVGPVRFRFILGSPGSAILDQVMLAP